MLKLFHMIVYSFRRLFYIVTMNKKFDNYMTSIKYLSHQWANLENLRTDFYNMIYDISDSKALTECLEIGFISNGDSIEAVRAVIEKNDAEGVITIYFSSQNHDLKTNCKGKPIAFEITPINAFTKDEYGTKIDLLDPVEALASFTLSECDNMLESASWVIRNTHKELVKYTMDQKIKGLAQMS